MLKTHEAILLPRMFIRPTAKYGVYVLKFVEKSKSNIIASDARPAK